MSDDDIQQCSAADFFYDGEAKPAAPAKPPARTAPAAAATPQLSPREKLLQNVQSRLKNAIGRSPYPPISDIVTSLGLFQSNIDMLAQDDKIGQNVLISTVVIDDFATVLATVSGNRLPDQHRQIIARVKTLFQEQFAKRTLPPEIKMLLAQLQIPFLKIAFIENDLLARENFSGRILFNQVVELGRTVERPLLKHNPLYAEYFRIIKLISQKFDRDVSTFNDIVMGSTLLRQKMQAPAKAAAAAKPAPAPEPAPAPVAKAPPPPPPKPKPPTAREKISHLVEKHQKGKKLPTRVAQFISATWKGIMETTLEKRGETSAEFENVADFLESLAWVSDMQLNLTDDSVIKETFTELLMRLNRGMESAAGDRKQQEQGNRLLLDLYLEKMSR